MFEIPAYFLQVHPYFLYSLSIIHSTGSQKKNWVIANPVFNVYEVPAFWKHIIEVPGKYNHLMLNIA